MCLNKILKKEEKKPPLFVHYCSELLKEQNHSLDLKLKVSKSFIAC